MKQAEIETAPLSHTGVSDPASGGNTGAILDIKDAIADLVQAVSDLSGRVEDLENKTEPSAHQEAINAPNEVPQENPRHSKGKLEKLIDAVRYA